jgi:hypothetical protein
MGPTTWKIRQFVRNGPLAVLMNVGGLLFRALFNTLFGVRLTDPTSMYKVVRADCLAGLSFTCNRFDFDYELLGKLIRAGFHPLEVPVSYKSRGFDEGKKIRIFRDPPTWVRAILNCRFASAQASASRCSDEVVATVTSPRSAHRHETSSPCPGSTRPGHSRSEEVC